MSDQFNRMQELGREATDKWVVANSVALKSNGIRVDEGFHNMLHALFCEGYEAAKRESEHSLRSIASLIE
jgi:hypothetical protein